MKFFKTLAIALLFAGLFGPSAVAQCVNGTCPRATYPTTTTYFRPAYTQPIYTAAAPTYTATPTYAAAAARPVYASATTYRGAYASAGTSVGGDPYGFLAWLNSTRASYGLSPVSYDANLAGWAASNNAQQNRRGLGHYVMGGARRQNSAMGSYSQIGPMWLASAPHRAALLDPTITRIGLAGSGRYWTFNAN